MRCAWLVLMGFVATPWSGQACAAETAHGELLERLHEEEVTRAANDASRLARFEQAYRNDSTAQQREAAELTRLQTAHALLASQIDAEQENADELHRRLSRQIEELDRLFTILREQAADLATQLAASPVSAGDPDRTGLLREVAGRESNPGLGDLEQMWHAMLGELVEQGRVVRLKAPLVTADGRESIIVSRTGVFTTRSDRGLLLWDPSAGAYRLPARQAYARPETDRSENADTPGTLLIDTGRGAGLQRLAAIPGWQTRILSGGNIAGLILALGAIGGGAALLRWFFLVRMGGRMRRQAVRPHAPRDDNPLGRILLVPQRMTLRDAANLALALDEAVLREVSGLRRGDALIRLLAALTPLLGLLGTVTGMIATFESITRYGTGDPVLMADGISQALVSTWLGLGAAVPLVLAHAWLGSLSRTLIDRLEEASSALIASEARE